MSKPKLAQAEKRRQSALRRQAFHAGRLAAAATPQKRITVMVQRIEAIMRNTSPEHCREIEARVTPALRRIADVADEEVIRGTYGRGTYDRRA